ncbi:RNA-binding protein [Lutibacter sp. B2]|nr:RNA-binding protein [Lutibacter sp. B2]
MIEMGRVQKLKISNIVDFGAYLDANTDDSSDNILLPNNQLPTDAQEGDEVEVFVYRDSKDRPIASRKNPLIQVDELAYLTVVQTTEIGAFLDMGLEKDLFLPFAEQKYKVQVGGSYLVYAYLDKSERLAATTDVDKYLSNNSNHMSSDIVTGTIYKIVSEIGAFIAVDNKYRGLIQKNEYFNDLRTGDVIEARIITIREDGKLDLSTRKMAFQQMNVDGDMILEEMNKSDGFIPLNDKSSAGEIKNRFKISKSAFKRAIGGLLKQDKIDQTEEGIKLK